MADAGNWWSPSAGLVIFTDLDGTLLDHRTYGWREALPALRIIRRRGVPLIFCTSKTRSETEALRARMGNAHPFVVENGAAVCLPRGYFRPSPPGARRRGVSLVVELGAPRALLAGALERMGRSTGLSLRGISSLPLAEVRRLTGLGRVGARRALQREYSEPFLAGGDGEDRLPALERAAAARGLLVTRGGRFFHLSTGGDKGRAVDLLTRLYRGAAPGLRTVGLGDSRNDLPMLRRVDLPILVARPDGSYDQEGMREGFTPAGGVGPAGWNRALLRLLTNAAQPSHGRRMAR